MWGPRTLLRGPEPVLVFQLKRGPRMTRFCWTTSSPSSLLVRSLSGDRGLGAVQKRWELGVP